MKQNEKIVPNSCEKLRNLKRRRGTLCEIVKNKVIYFSQFSYKQFRDALKENQECGAFYQKVGGGPNQIPNFSHSSNGT